MADIGGGQTQERQLTLGGVLRAESGERPEALQPVARRCGLGVGDVFWVMSEQDGSAGGSSNLKGFLGLAAIASVFLSLAVQPEESRICEDENGFDYITVTCEHQFLLSRLFSPSYCSVTYKTEGGRRLSSFSEPAKRVDTQYHFAALEMMTFDPDLAVFESRSPLFIEVDFDKYTIETKGAFSQKFNNCRGGDY